MRPATFLIFLALILILAAIGVGGVRRPGFHRNKKGGIPDFVDPQTFQAMTRVWFTSHATAYIGYNPKFSVEAWFLHGANQQAKNALELQLKMYRLNQGRMSLFHVVGPVQPEELKKIRTVPTFRNKDTLLIVGKEQHVLTDSQGKQRRIRFVGMPGRDYSLQDFVAVVDQVFQERLPQEKFRRPRP